MVLFRNSLLAINYRLATRLISTTSRTQSAESIRTIERPLKKTTNRDHAGTTKLWKWAFFVAALPSVILVKLNYDLYGDHHPERPEFKEFEYLRKRVKPLPWGDGNHTLFHNSHYNALPGVGYEEETEEHSEH